ncbi:hypothetical protein ACLBR5_14455 [Escherichia coli]
MLPTISGVRYMTDTGRRHS